MPPAPTAVVADEWPLVRIGMAQALRAAEVRVVAETGLGEEALRRHRDEEATYLLVGMVRDVSLVDMVRRAARGTGPARVLVFLDHVGRDELVAIVSQGADALLVRSATPEEVADAVGRVGRGERVIAPVLLPLLVGVLGIAADADDAGAGLLTRKEREVLARLAQGMSNREIADALYVTPATVKTHLAHIYTKLGVTGRQEALAKAVSLGLLG